jgi:CheY-like chemotaxis protein
MFSGQELVDSLETLRPDVLIMDVEMPGMTGIEAAIITRRKLPNCKILLWSGRAATSGLLLKAREQGHEFELLGKPVNLPDLLAKLRTSSEPNPVQATTPIGHNDPSE